MATKSRTLIVDMTVRLEVDYSPSDLEKLDKTFREFKSGVEHLVKADLLPSFQADEHSRLHLGTISYPSPRKLKMNQRKITCQKQIALKTT